MGRLKSKRYLLKALEIAGLPSTYMSLMKYEKLGIIPVSENNVSRRTDSDDRFYTLDQILDIVKGVMTYKKSPKLQEIDSINSQITEYINNN